MAASIVISRLDAVRESRVDAPCPSHYAQTVTDVVISARRGAIKGASMILAESFYRGNVARIAEALSAASHDALLLTTPANIAYATSFYFRPTERPLAACVWADGTVALLTPYLEAEAAAQGWVRDIRWYPEYPSQPTPWEWMAREAGAGRLVVDRLDASAHAIIARVADHIEQVDLVERLRSVKHPDEVRFIARAADYADLAIERLYARLTTGATERELVAAVTDEIAATMRRDLGDRYAPLDDAVLGTVHAGARAALPHGLTTNRRLTRGDIVIGNFVCNVGGYHAEAACTFFMGDPLREVVQFVELSIRAQDAARAALSSGGMCSSVDAAARAVFAGGGMSNALRRRTGHSVGLERQESPWLAEGDDTRLVAGMVAANAPAIYVQGRLGVRNAETVAVEDDGPRVLNPRIARWRDLEARLKEF